MPLNDVAPFRVLPRRPVLSHLRRDVPQVTSAIIDQRLFRPRSWRAAEFAVAATCNRYAVNSPKRPI
jgi:hypothetical protein